MTVNTILIRTPGFSTHECVMINYSNNDDIMTDTLVLLHLFNANGIQLSMKVSMRRIIVTYAEGCRVIMSVRMPLEILVNVQHKSWKQVVGHTSLNIHLLL